MQHRLIAVRMNHGGLGVVGILFPAKICARSLWMLAKPGNDSVLGYIFLTRF
jgi:hypothetical protein